MISRENLLRAVTALTTLELVKIAPQDRVQILAGRKPTTKALRLQAGLDLLNQAIPVRAVAKKLSSLTREVPLSVESLSLIAFGYEHNVYRINGRELLILKVDRNSLFLPVDQQEEIAQKRNQACKTYIRFFGHLPDVITPEYFFVGRSPVLHLRAVQAIQKFLPQNYVDFFTGQKTLPRLLEQEHFRRSFLSFYSALDSMLESGLCPDLCGKNNLVIADDPKGGRLMFTEGHSTFEYTNGTINDVRLRANGADKMFQERIAFVKNLAQQMVNTSI